MRGPGHLHDVVDAGRVEPALGEHARTGVEQAVAGALAAGPQLPRRRPSAEAAGAASGQGYRAPDATVRDAGRVPGKVPRRAPRFDDLSVGDEAPPLVVENLDPHALREVRRARRATSTRCTTTTRSPPRSGTRRCSATACSPRGSWPGSSRTGSVRRRCGGSRCASPSRCGRATCSRSPRSSPASAEEDGEPRRPRARRHEPGRRGEARRHGHCASPSSEAERSGSHGAPRRSGRGRHRVRAAASGASSRCAMAREGAKVVVNDVGVSLDGQGTDEDPAAQVCKEIEALGGERCRTTTRSPTSTRPAGSSRPRSTRSARSTSS